MTKDPVKYRNLVNQFRKGVEKLEKNNSPIQILDTAQNFSIWLDDNGYEIVEKKKMKKFLLYLKSHCEYPDYEREVEANTKEEALKKIREETGNSLIEWEDDVLLECLDEIPEV